MSTKWPHKICICSVNFFNLQGLQYYFAENFRCNLEFCESENFFLVTLSIAFSNTKILGFLFSAKNSLI